ncbi:carbamoyltransferase C-terminal domain-containing protein [Mesorhizobium sp.]|uniref:carbamoyltransferase C-terminal domain-containing protein n=1 Tax=Mesorhizobium sp. TaxID=1871066 RepID=UPI000FE72A98|nr:carbamoyltransferase C-terminal domain-containing protein [Mesorhizobium sp.]RWE56390.1 MAG: carbamoyltransferase [Mesorhizobium sp.]
MRILGVHDGHGSSASLVTNGRLRRVLQEERFSRVKNQGGLPVLAIREILDLEGIGLSDIDLVAFATQRFRNPRMHDSGLVHATFLDLFRGTHYSQQSSEMAADDLVALQDTRSSWFKAGGYSGAVTFVDHHLCHALVALHGTGASRSPCLVMTCDGQGDGLSATVSAYEGGTLTLLDSVHRDDSVAQIYSYITFLLGFLPLEHEYKLMGLAPYGASSQSAMQVSRLLAEMFLFEQARPFSWRRAELVPKSELMPAYLVELLRYRRFDDIAAGLQMFFEEFIVQWVQRSAKAAGMTRVAVGGGAFMNVKLNGRLATLPELTSVDVFPSCGDESNSIGAAYAHSDRIVANKFDIRTGRVFGNEAIEKLLGGIADLRIKRVTNIASECASLLSSGEIVARFDGGSEFGARALGNRSILADPRRGDLIEVLNRAIKNRDFWMPFAATIMEPYADGIIHRRENKRSAHMMYTFSVRDSARKSVYAALHPRDFTCRAQLLERPDNERYYELLEQFLIRTGVPALLNTSFNLHGEPIVETPSDAIRVFMKSGLRHLVLGDLMIEKMVS